MSNEKKIPPPSKPSPDREDVKPGLGKERNDKGNSFPAYQNPPPPPPKTEKK